MSDNLITIKDAAKILKVHWQTVRNYIDKGKLPASKIGRQIRIKESDLQKLIDKNENEQEKYEIEIRYAVESAKALQEKLLELDAEIIYHGHIIDHWFAENSIRGLEQQNDFYDSGKGYGLRIREQDNGYTGKVTTSLEVKRLAEPHKHETCIEQEIDIASYDEAYKLLKLMNYKEFVTIDKSRTIYNYKDTKIVIDDIKDYLTAIELEKVTSEDKKKVLKELNSIATQLNLDEPTRTKKSVTHMMIEEFGEF
jgi:predicted adenylyl cyclase CyaB